MGFKKTHWLFHLLALIAIVALASVRCGHDPADKNPPSIKETPHDCPPDNSCREGHCATNPVNNNKNEEQEKEKNEIKTETDAGDEPDTARHCETAEDCGCSYECVDSQCRKIDSSCCANADCDAGFFCTVEEDQVSGECLPWQCDEDSQCENECGNTHCENHRCLKEFCCSDAECPNGKLCSFFGNAFNISPYGYCALPECTSDADCYCGQVCSSRQHWCTSYSDQPIKCCGTGFYYAPEKSCLPRKYIENGNCLGDEHCQTGKVCIDQKCYPETCAENADCGCEAVCRKGRCELGCDDNSGCCNEGHICDRGRCINPNEEAEEEE